MRSLSGWSPWGKSCKELHCFSRPWSCSPMLSSNVRHSYQTLPFRCPMMGTPFDQGSIKRHWNLYKKTSKIELGSTPNSCMMIQSESQNDVYMTPSATSDDPRITLGWPPNDPRITLEWSSDDPQMTLTWPSDDPQMIHGWHLDDPRMTLWWSSDDPRMTPRWQSDEPQMITGWPPMSTQCLLNVH